MTTNTAGATQTPALLAEYPTYEQAQAAVDRLSDNDFPVQEVTIVWNRLRQIESVIGRRTVASAAGQGALSGAWLGLIFALVLVLFVDIANAIGFVVTYVVVGAVLGAVWWGLRHWSQRGRRDFASAGRLEAESYEVWVSRPNLARASAIVGVTQAQ